MADFLSNERFRQMKRSIGFPLIAALSAILICQGCGSSGNDSDASGPTDYSQADHWLNLPSSVTEPVDVFYLYPTAWTSTDPDNPQVCAIDEPSMLEKAPGDYARQATAFETVANIYAPYYRQDNSSPVDRLHVIAGIPTMDAAAAFEYYIKHYNNGHPYFLLGHSQGATVLSNILSGYMKTHPEVYKRMIAAYVIGNPVSAEYLRENPHLKFAEGPDDTGVIISYNTEAPDVDPSTNPVLYGEVGLVINPISWTREETEATVEQGLGSLMPRLVEGKLEFVPVPQYADAKIDTARGVLICSTCNEEEFAPIDTAEGFPVGVYHVFDISFYYFNIRANAANRAGIFLQNH
jgi:hypothetical protein